MATSPIYAETGPAYVGGPAQAILRGLNALVRQKPELASAVAFYRALLPILYIDQAEVATFTLDAETVRRKIGTGMPLLVGENLPLDIEAAQSLFLRLCRLIEASPNSTPPYPAWPARYSPESQINPSRPIDLEVTDARVTPTASYARTTAASRIRQAVESGDLDLVAILQAVAASRWREGVMLATGLQLDPGVLRMLAELSLIPALCTWAQAVSSQVDLDLWRRGTCPVCGSQPILSEIQGKGGTRRLRCAMCGADWYYPRLGCSFCQMEDYRSIGIISVDGEEEKYRLQTCDACRGYIKVVVTFEPTPVGLLAVEDLATLHLDLIARERGFARVPVQSTVKGQL